MVANRSSYAVDSSIASGGQGSGVSASQLRRILQNTLQQQSTRARASLASVKVVPEDLQVINPTYMDGLAQVTTDKRGGHTVMVVGAVIAAMFLLVLYYLWHKRRLG